MRNWDELTEDETKLIRFAVWKFGSMANKAADELNRLGLDNQVQVVHFMMAHRLLEEMKPNGGQSGQGGVDREVQGAQAGEDRGEQSEARGEGIGPTGSGQGNENTARNGAGAEEGG